MTCNHCCGADQLFDLKGAQKLGAVCTLTKPIDRDEMLRAIKDVLQSPSSQNGQ